MASTMKEVAALAGVSISSVSHVLNGTRPVSPPVRARIEEAMRALSYTPSELARSLKGGPTRTLGVMLPNCSNPFFASLVRHIEARCFDDDYTVILCNTDDDPEKQETYLRMLQAKRIDGLFVIASADDGRLPALLAEAPMPLVLVDRELGLDDHDLVSVDHQHGGYVATRHLIGLGHRRIGCIAGPADLPASARREAGWRRAMQEAGLDPAPGWLVRGDFTCASGERAMDALLARMQPDAVFACNDLMAIGAMHAAQRSGRRIPEDLAVIGFDGIELGAYLHPSLSTICQPQAELAASAFDMMMARRTDPACAPRSRFLQGTLQARGSTGTSSV